MAVNVPHELQDWLLAASQAALPGAENARLSAPQQIASGWESEIFACDLDWQQDGQPRRQGLVLRLYTGQGAGGKAEHEFKAMSTVRALGYPVPRVYGWDSGARAGRAVLVMDRIEGPTLWQLLEQASGGPRLPEILEQFSRLAVALHALNSGGQAPPGPFGCWDEMLAGARPLLERFEGLGLLPLADWLDAQRSLAACPRPAWVHWDFHPGNVLLDSTGQGWVIDWTGARISDPRFDLAWTLVLALAYGPSGLREDLLARYERLRGAAVENLHIFEVFACGRRLFDVGVSLAHGAEALGMRPEAEAQMRASAPGLRRIYGYLQTLSGLQLPQVEAHLRALEGN